MNNTFFLIFLAFAIMIYSHNQMDDFMCNGYSLTVSGEICYSSAESKQEARHIEWKRKTYHTTPLS